MANDFLEKTLEQIIFENKDILTDRGLPIFYKNAKRQMYLPTGKRIDIFTWEISDDNTIYARIIECKREAINETCYWQALNYYSDMIGAFVGNFKSAHCEIILIGNSISENVKNAIHLTDLIRTFKYAVCPVYRQHRITKLFHY